jgi:phenylacetate-coenzyme A ligase PaaK-like adenylate-forming protein
MLRLRPDTWPKLVGLARFSLGARRLLTHTITSPEAQAIIRDGVVRRHQHFLATLNRAVYANRSSPYRRLLLSAGCEQGDIARLVETEGLETALGIIAGKGVFVTYDEFKGRRPAVRGSQTFHFAPDDFNDPSLASHISASTSGTRGQPVSVPIDADHIAELTPSWSIFLEEHKCFDGPLMFWTPGHPGVAARYLSCAQAGLKYADWFISEDAKSIASRTYAEYVHRFARWAGGFPAPVRTSFAEPEWVLTSVLARLREHGNASMNTAPSAAVKLSLAAQEHGASLAGLTFLLGSEPLTPARRRTIEACGARAAALYGSSEAPWIGGQCQNPVHPDDVHVLRDGYAIVRVQPSMTAAGVHDEALLLTSLRKALPKVLLNTDIGDRGVIDDHSPCDCLYAQLGCGLRLHTIRSADKITEFGVTFAVGDVFRVLEEALPSRFGGIAGDYQLVEMRRANGLPHYAMMVNPRLTGIDDDTVLAAFFSEIGRLEDHYRFMAAAWAREKVISVRRAAPLIAASGKVLPFLRTADGSLTGDSSNG